jgi:hypothetical protein
LAGLSFIYAGEPEVRREVTTSRYDHSGRLTTRKYRSEYLKDVQEVRGMLEVLADIVEFPPLHLT